MSSCWRISLFQYHNGRNIRDFIQWSLQRVVVLHWKVCGGSMNGRHDTGIMIRAPSTEDMSYVLRRLLSSNDRWSSFVPSIQATTHSHRHPKSAPSVALLSPLLTCLAVKDRTTFFARLLHLIYTAIYFLGWNEKTSAHGSGTDLYLSSTVFGGGLRDFAALPSTDLTSNDHWPR